MQKCICIYIHTFICIVHLYTLIHSYSYLLTDYFWRLFVTHNLLHKLLSVFAHSSTNVGAFPLLQELSLQLLQFNIIPHPYLSSSLPPSSPLSHP